MAMFQNLGSYKGGNMINRFLMLGTGFFCVVVLSGCPSSSANRVYVVPSSTGIPDGTSWATAFTSIQGAIEDAYARESQTGQPYEVWVKKGTYLQSTSIVMRPGINVIGNFNGDEASSSQWSLPNPNVNGDPTTVIAAASMSPPAISLVRGAPGSILSGFTLDGSGASGISGMYNTDLGAEAPIVSCCSLKNFNTSAGGGILSSDCSLSIVSCHIYNNVSTQGMAGVWAIVYDDNDQNYSITINNCVFDHNTSSLVGEYGCSGQASGAWVGGDCDVTVSSTTFEDNYACDSGGALRCGSGGNHISTVSDCDFVNNTAGSRGAIYVTGAAVIEKCLFNGNASTEGPGAIEGGTDTVLPLYINKCTFLGNSGMDGGAVLGGLNTLVVNSIFVQNKARRDGGAIYIFGSSGSPVVNSCTFTMNQANTDTTGGSGSAIHASDGMNLLVYNSILYGDIGDEIAGSSNTVVGHSDIQGGYSGVGNLNIIPSFIDPPSSMSDATFDLHLQISPSSSACINAALDSYPYSPDVDIEETSRPQGSAPDMGAFECE